MDLQEVEQATPSEEQMNALLDLFEKIPPVPISRNDPCPCGSRKKYKKCCLSKNKGSAKSVSPNLETESCIIVTRPLTEEEAQNNFEAVSADDAELMASLYHDLNEHGDRISSESCDYFEKLNALRTKYPDNPVILNYLTKGYSHLGQKDRAKQLIAETCERFPDYLFALTAQASIYLLSGFPDEAIQLFKGKYSLKHLYPHRSVFHITEFKAFEALMVQYFCKLENFKQANIRLQAMQEILEEEDTTLRDVQELFKMSKAVYNLKAGMARLLGLAKRDSD